MLELEETKDIDPRKLVLTPEEIKQRGIATKISYKIDEKLKNISNIRSLFIQKGGNSVYGETFEKVLLGIKNDISNEIYLDIKNFIEQEKVSKNILYKDNDTFMLSLTVKNFDKEKQYYDSEKGSLSLSSETGLTGDFSNAISQPDMKIFGGGNISGDFFKVRKVFLKYKQYYNIEHIEFIPEVEHKIQLLDTLLEDIINIASKSRLSIDERKQLVLLIVQFEIYLLGESQRIEIEDKYADRILRKKDIFI